MQAPDPIETIMARLMPPALSEDCQSGIDEMLDDLAGPSNIVGISWLSRCLIGGGIAAGIGALCAIFPMIQKSPQPVVAANSAAGFSLESGSERIESVTDEGWRKDSEGSTMHAVRFNTVRETQVRDKESGMLVRISEPREEILMMPISEFYQAPVLRKPSGGILVETATLSEANNGPVRVVNVTEKCASIAADEGLATVRREGGIFSVKISGPQGELIFEGDVSQTDLVDKVPVEWHRRILVLCRTLDQVLDENTTPERQPQTRLVPPVTAKPGS